MRLPEGNRIFATAVGSKKIAYIFIALAFIVGTIGLFRMNRDQLPEFKIKQGLVAAIYPGATADEVNEQVAKPLEDVLLSFPEVIRRTMKTVCRDGICYIYVDLNVEVAEKEEVWSKIKHRLNVAKLMLPPQVAAIVVLDDFSKTSTILIALDSDDKGNMEMRRYAEDLCARLRSIESLAEASVIGGQEEEIAVTLDSDRLADYGINPASLMLRYQSATLNSGGGTFDTDYATSPIHIDNPVTSEQELEDYIVYSDDAGGVLRLRDIASVERRIRADSPSLSYNGHTAVVVNVIMRAKNNVVEFGEEVDAVLAEFSAGLPDSVHISRITDKPKHVRIAIMNFLRDLLIAMLVVIVVMLLLFPVRSALIAGSGVPVCTFVTIALMYVFGIELNTVTLAALIVVLGMIVDDSIITMDGYMLKLGKYSDREKAASESSRELFLPMLLATTAIAVMFIPCPHIMKGYMGDFIRPFPWIIGIALFSSLAYAMFVVPSLEVRFIKTAHPVDNAFLRVQNRFFNGLQALYDKCEEFCFRKPAFTIAIGVVAIGLGVLMFSRVSIQMLPKADMDCFAVEITLDVNSSIRDTRAASDSLAAILRADPRVKSVTAFVGQSAPRFQATYTPLLPGPNVAMLIVNTVSNSATVAVLRDYESRYEHAFPRAMVNFRQIDYQYGNSVEVILEGRHVDDLKPCSDSLLAFMQGMSDVLKGISSEQGESLPCVNITLNPEEAARLGVDKTMLSLSLQGLMDGRNIATIYEGDEKVPVNLYSSLISSDMDYTDLGNVLVPSLKPGVSVPLSQVADITPSWRKSQVTRVSGRETIAVMGNTKMGQGQPAAMRTVKGFVDSNIRPMLPEGASIKYGGLEDTNGFLIPDVAKCFVVAVLILFAFLLIHFRKISIALLTLTLSVLCLFGASFGLWLFGMDLTMPAVLGLISLVGIIVRNGIIMFDYAEELRQTQGLDVREAAMLAGQRRMRPIFLTSCTTALGVLPMILSRDALWMPMGLVICFGTMLSIGLIVLIMPVSYWQVFKHSH
ncbi:MAG: efflux RND transporter permease subunit [Bacteroidales bacterium]|nr:efflux RND transporter permease subunit [Bacteroidales bacterium]